MLWFRLFRVALSAGIEKIIRQVYVAPEHKKYQQIVCKEHSQNSVEHYQPATSKESHWTANGTASRNVFYWLLSLFGYRGRLLGPVYIVHWQQKISHRTEGILDNSCMHGFENGAHGFGRGSDLAGVFRWTHPSSWVIDVTTSTAFVSAKSLRHQDLIVFAPEQNQQTLADRGTTVSRTLIMESYGRDFKSAKHHLARLVSG